MTEDPDLAPDPTPDLAEPVAGWRVWRVHTGAGGPEIVSPVRPVGWPARRRMTAACDRGCATVPTPTCGCGLYALADPVGLPPNTAGQGRVVGCTALWGRTIEHTGGFRAEHGYPLVLLVRTDLRSMFRGRARLREGVLSGSAGRQSSGGLLARDLASRYGVPVGVIPDHAALPGRIDVPGARVVALEATRGLAARRAGDLGAHERLAAAAREVFGHGDWFAPAA
ncbi:hypothetical protein [Actinomycetospora chiangmaiensis]|uniref:hypothetical protein n=1 Tax=Actinomycetospora chiangmaiensis TaxID=402650 RepID=UPI0003790D7F|nr:hypothetical protein [Actinomycetospora chiangmaiensis]